MQTMQPLGTAQFGQQFQAYPQQYAPQVPQKSYEEIVCDISKSAKKDSMTSQLVSTLSTQSGYPLQLESLFWNKYSKLRVKAWGGAVTDHTLLVNNQRMPIIRKPNYCDATWPVSLDTVPITIGNEKKDEFASKQLISLRDYLSNINEYITSRDTKKDSEDEKEAVRKVSLLAKDDNTVIMNTQCCLLPVDSNGATSFSIATMNWKAGLKNPSCLYIVSCVNGTSSVVIEGNFQKVYFNKNGKKAPFTLSVNDQDPNQCITIIQVPLRQKNRKQIEQEQATNSSWGLSNWWSSGSETKRVFDVLPTNCKDAQVQALLKEYGYHEIDETDDVSAAKISRSGIKVVPCTAPTYCCTRELVKGEAQTCYGEKNANITVSCDGCGGSYSGDAVIWHCPETIAELHPNGYDLCNECAQRQVVHDELRGLKGLRRDERYAIRATLLYYKPIIAGVAVAQPLIHEIVQKLVKSDNLGRVQVPQTQVQTPIMAPITYKSTPQQMNVMPAAQAAPQVAIRSIPQVAKVKVNPAEYQLVGSALKELKLSSEYLKVFQSQNVTDSDLKLLNDNDLNVLFACVGARARFRAWLNENGRRINGDSTKNVDRSEYRKVNEILRSLNVNNAAKYVLNFVNNGITDKMMQNLSDADLKILIPEMSARVLFRASVMKKQAVITPPQYVQMQARQMNQAPIQMQQQQQVPVSQQQFLF